VSTRPAAIADQTGIVPIRLVIGVTGHRTLAQQDKLGEKVQAALGMIRDRIEATVENLRQELKAKLPEIPVIFRALSPLGEGADRLVAREVLKTDRGQLEAILPLPRADYEFDFQSASSPPGSLDEFRELFKKANSWGELPLGRHRPDVYLKVGQYVVDHCDVLIALWDHEPSPGVGGPSAIYEYAKGKRRPIIWIDTLQLGNDPLFVKESRLSLETVRQIALYNAESVNTAEFDREVAVERERLVATAQQAGYSLTVLNSICDDLLPPYVRADQLAEHYRWRYQTTGAALHLSAVAAVALLALQAVFFGKWIWPVVAEIMVIVLGFGLWKLGDLHRWQTKYIDYRFLAERFRAAIFAAAADMERTALEAPRYLSLAFSESDWVVSAFSTVRDSVSHRNAEPSEPGFERLKQFLIDAWIDPQINYHRSNKERQERWDGRDDTLISMLALFTFYAAVLHLSTELGPGILKLWRRIEQWSWLKWSWLKWDWVRAFVYIFHFNLLAGAAHLIAAAAWHHRIFLNHLFTWLAIVFPAGAAGVSAIRNQRERKKISHRSAEMARNLKELKDSMTDTDDRDTFLALVREADETMLYENEDWRVVIRYRANEPLA